MTLRDELADSGEKFSKWLSITPLTVGKEGGYTTESLQWAYEAGQDAVIAVFKRHQLDPDMPAQEIRLHMGELTTQELYAARAAIRWANSIIMAQNEQIAEGE